MAWSENSRKMFQVRQNRSPRQSTPKHPIATSSTALDFGVGISRPPTSDVIAQVSLTLSYPELFQVTGPLPSLVLRAEDMWRKHNHCHRSWQGSQSGFPLLTLKCPLLCSVPSTKVLNTVHS